MNQFKPPISHWALLISMGVIAPHADAGSVVADVAGDLQGAGTSTIGSPVKPPPRPIKPPPPPENPGVPTPPPITPAPPGLPVQPPSPKLPPVPAPIETSPGVTGSTSVEPGKPGQVLTPDSGLAKGIKTPGASGSGQSVSPAMTNQGRAIPLSPLDSMQPGTPATSGNEGKRPANRKGRTSVTPKKQ